MFKILLKLTLSMLTVCCFGKSVYNNFSADISNVKTCECVSFVLCENESQIIDGAGLIDVRAVKKSRSGSDCKDVLEVCCDLPNIRRREPEKDSKPALESHRYKQGRCGVRNADGIGLRIMSQNENEAKFGEFPWMVAVLHNSALILDLYQCGGSLIHRNVVLTAAHCVYGKNASGFKVRAGEWNTQTTDEVFPHQDRSVKSIIIHENYDPRSLRNDFALLILTSPVSTAENVDIVCLPGSSFDSTKCIVSGWGKNEFGRKGQYGAILKKVELSMTPRLECQSSLRKTRLGKIFELDQSFICAGGTEGHDSCKGDGGSPLVCPLKSNPQRYVQVGIVSWGIGCGSNLSAVYANVNYARNWIDEQLMMQNLDNAEDRDINSEVFFSKAFYYFSNGSSNNNHFNDKNHFLFNVEGNMFYPSETSNVNEDNGLDKDRISELKCIEYSRKTSESFWILKSTPIQVRRECPRLTNKLLAAGGEATKPHEFPHMAALGKRLNEYTTRYFCAGSVISENWILTAAHCGDSDSGFPTVALLGSTTVNPNNSKIKGGKLVPVKRIVQHPKYRRGQLYADLALVELSEPVNFTSSLKPACLYSLPRAAPKRLWLSGWGAKGLGESSAATSSLRKTRLRLLEPERCVDEARLPRGFDEATQMCAGDVEGTGDAGCTSGDAGAPLQARHPLGCLAELFAVASRGAACDSPGVYIRISPYVAWIESVVWPESTTN